MLFVVREEGTSNDAFLNPVISLFLFHKQIT
jgi:hypothetical protein